MCKNSEEQESCHEDREANKEGFPLGINIDATTCDNCHHKSQYIIKLPPLDGVTIQLCRRCISLDNVMRQTV